MSKTLLIVEKASMPVSQVDKNSDGEYILEGVFTEFNVRNNNNRVYLAEDFLKHIDTLKSKIEENKLLGELDHPSGFDISLKNVSHVIEKLTYDKERKCVIGRIKLLNTSAGKEAKALVDGKVPLHISSRAAGVVENDGTVRLKQLFTYDLVAEPGFSNAKLKRVNESFGYNPDLVGFFDCGDIDNNKNNMSMDKTVTIDQLETYTKDWKREFTALKESVNANTNSRDVISKLSKLDEMTKTMSTTIEMLVKHNDHLVDSINNVEAELKETKKNQNLLESYNDNNLVTAIEELQNGFKELSSTVNKLVKHNDHIVENVEKHEQYLNYITENVNKRFEYMDYLAEELEKSIKYTEYVAENLDKSIEYTEHVAESVNEQQEKQVAYLDYLAEQLTNSIKHTDYVAENVNGLIGFAEHIAENTSKTQQYANYLGENLNKSIEFTEHVAENTKKTQQYADYLGENLNKSIEFTEHVAENTKKTQEYSNYLAENLNKSIQYTDYVAENTKKSHDYLQYMGEAINESNGYKRQEVSIDSKLDAILESAKVRKTETLKKNNFLGMLLENQVKRFNGLDNTKQDSIYEDFASKLFTNPRDAQAYFEQVMSGDNELAYIKNMPDKYKSTWNRLSESQKQVIKGQAKYRVLETQENINEFWKTRDLLLSERQDLLKNNTQINESNNTVNLDPYMQSLAKQIRQRFDV